MYLIDHHQSLWAGADKHDLTGPGKIESSDPHGHIQVPTKQLLPLWKNKPDNPHVIFVGKNKYKFNISLSWPHLLFYYIFIIPYIGIVNYYIILPYHFTILCYIIL